MRGRIQSLSRGIDGNWTITFSITPTSIGEARKYYDIGKDLSISLKEWKEKRSLTANAYFHVLVNKLASAMKISDEECKRWLVLSYGTVAERNGCPVMITLPKETDPLDYYPYCQWIDGDATSDSYQLYKQTHILDTKEFSRLLDGTVQECKEQGIETMSEDEIRRLYAQADKSM